MSWNRKMTEAFCDGCGNPLANEEKWYTFKVDGEDPSSRHFHEACWLTGWYTRIEPKAEWRTDPETAISGPLRQLLNEVASMMEGRHKKYGPGNIAKHGPLGILVRMDDKFARLESGQQNFSDETVQNTLDDIIGYALIWKMWLNGDWPGSNSSGSVTMTTEEDA